MLDLKGLGIFPLQQELYQIALRIDPLRVNNILLLDAESGQKLRYFDIDCGIKH